MENSVTTRQMGPGGVDFVRFDKPETKSSPANFLLPDSDRLDDNLQDLLFDRVTNPEQQEPLNQDGLQFNTSNKLSPWDKFRRAFVQGPPLFQAFRSKFTLSLNYFGIAFNALAVIGKSFLPKNIYKFVDEKSEWYSKYVIPLSFSWNALEALVGHRLPEAFSRIVPAVSFWALPFYNFNLATGVSSALNYIFEHVKERHGGKNPAAGNLGENLKQTVNTSVDVLIDIVKGKRDKEDLFKQLGTVGLLFGSLGGMIFTRQARDSFWARVFGNMRNIGGLIADYKLIFNNAKDPQQSRYQREVGTMCSIASILNIFMRWVNPEMARMLNHISIAMDDFGLTRWAQVSKEDNDRELTKTILHAT